MTPLVEARGLMKHFPVRRGFMGRMVGKVRALDGVDLELRRGECFGLVGESGSGKTTLGRCLMRLLEPDAGRILFDGEDLLSLSGDRLRRRRRRFQMVFQDPYGSLDPRLRVGAILEEPLRAHGLAQGRRHERVGELLSEVGLSGDAARRFPHQFSGGQRQRIGIARALATEPDLLVADEPVSALDVSVQAQIINLLVRLQEDFGLTLLFIAHDLAVVEQIADRVAVMYLGRMVEVGRQREVFERPLHPYTVSLLSAVPVPEVGGRRGRAPLRGELPSPVDPPSGCPFHPRCPIARRRCAAETPRLRSSGDGSAVACFFPGELEADAFEGPSGGAMGWNFPGSSA